jgi:hypothetical protein
MLARPKPRRLSEVVLAIDLKQTITVGSLIDEFGDRAFGALIFILSIPNLIPAPPGTSTVLGLPLLILTFQLMVGRPAVWLPEKIRNRQVSAGLIQAFNTHGMAYLQKIERYLKPRFSWLANSTLSERIMGVVSFILAVILVLPVPFVNIACALGIACIAIGLAERDGIAVVAGYAMAAGILFVSFFVSAAVIEGVKAFFHHLFGT